jgi:hypothetical protein
LAVIFQDPSNLKTLIYILAFTCLSKTCYSQKQERTLFFYNVGFGGLTSGIGAVINKPKGTNSKKYFVKGFWQGSVGGLINYSSKKTLYLNNLNQNRAFFWPAKILNSAGTSIMQNASLNQPFLENWYLDYGLLRVDFAIHNKDKFKVRLLPAGIYATIAASRLGKFDLENTLATGQIVFSNKNLFRFRNYNTQIGYSFGRGLVFVNNILAYPYPYKLLAHEIVHQFQYNDNQIFTTWLNPIGQKIKSKTLKTIFTKYVYPDLPFSLITYNLAGHYANPHYFRNFYEFEAERFSTNSYVPR